MWANKYIVDLGSSDSPQAHGVCTCRWRGLVVRVHAERYTQANYSSAGEVDIPASAINTDGSGTFSWALPCEWTATYGHGRCMH